MSKDKAHELSSPESTSKKVVPSRSSNFFIRLLTTSLALFSRGFNSTSQTISNTLIPGGFASTLAATTLSMIPIANAANNPSGTVAEGSGKKLKSESKHSSQDIENMLMPKEKVYVAGKGYGDWAFTLGNRMMPLSELLDKHGGTAYKDIHFVLIKNRDLVDIYKTKDADAFTRLIDNAKTRLERRFDEAGLIFKKTVMAISAGQEKSRSKDIVDKLANNIVWHTGANKDLVEKAIEQSFEEVQGAKLHEASFHEALKRNLKPIIFNNPMSQDWVALGKEAQQMSKNDRAYKKLSKYFDEVQRTSAERELYDFRKEVTRNFVADPNSEIIIADDNAKAAGDGLILAEGVSHQRGQFIFHNSPYLTLMNSYTHEALHHHDTTLCLMQDDKLLDIDFAEYVDKKFLPCGNEAGKFDHALPNEIKETFGMDAASLHSSTQKALTPDFISYVSSKIAPIKEILSADFAFPALEVFPMITDALDPLQLISSMPNLAVLRADRMILKSSDESKFYSAVMTCDFDAVKTMMKQNPNILESKYDNIALNQLSQFLVNYEYDDRVTYVGDKAEGNTYEDINIMIQDEYQKHNLVKKYSSSSKSNSGIEL